MNTPKNYLIVFLVLTTLGTGALAWRQYQELIALRASALNNDERADLQQRLWAAEKRRHELEATAAARANGPGGEFAEAPDAGLIGERRGGNRMANNFMSMMDKPEIQKLMAVQQRSGLDAHYAALFKSLNLSPAQLENFKNLLVEKQTALTDAFAAARAAGINPRTDSEDFQKLIADAQAEVDDNIKATLGAADFAKYQQYQQTLPQRQVVDQLAQSLSYTGTPLTATQSEQMVSILAANTPRAANSTTNNLRATVASNFGVGFNGLVTSPITNDAITQSKTVLSPGQVTALQQLQATQQAQNELNSAMRNQFRNAGPPGGTTITNTPAPPKSGPGGG